MSKQYINFYSYDDLRSDNVGIITAKDNNSTIVNTIIKTLSGNLSFVPSAEENMIDVLMDGKRISSFRIPDEASYEDASYDETTKTMTFKYDKDGVNGEKTVDLKDLANVWQQV